MKKKTFVGIQNIQMKIKTQTNQIDTPVLNSKCQYNHVIHGCIGGSIKPARNDYLKEQMSTSSSAAAAAIVLSHAHVITNRMLS